MRTVNEESECVKREDRKDAASRFSPGSWVRDFSPRWPGGGLRSRLGCRNPSIPSQKVAAMLPQRPPGFQNPAPSYETVKRRVLTRLEDRLNMSASRRMPQSLLRQTLRQ